MEALLWIAGLLAAGSVGAVGIGYANSRSAGSSGATSTGGLGAGFYNLPGGGVLTVNPDGTTSVSAGIISPYTDPGPSMVKTAAPTPPAGGFSSDELADYLDEFGIGTAVAEAFIAENITQAELQAQVYPGYVARGGGVIKQGEAIVRMPGAPASAPISFGSREGQAPTQYGIVVRSTT